MTQPPIALVTGAARRIGRALAQRLAHDGFDVALHTSERSRSDTEALADLLRQGGARAMVVVADLADAGETAEILPQVHETLGDVQVLVNNASLFEPDAAGDFNPGLFERHMAINLRAPLLLASDLASQRPAATARSIINIIDQRVWRLNPTYFTYTLAKSALWTATQTMAQAFAPHVRVNAIGPGPTAANTRQNGDDFAHEAASVLLREAVDPEQIADAMAYLVHARSVTGQMIAVDGGQHLAWETPDAVGLSK